MNEGTLKKEYKEEIKKEFEKNGIKTLISAFRPQNDYEKIMENLTNFEKKFTFKSVCSIVDKCDVLFKESIDSKSILKCSNINEILTGVDGVLENLINKINELKEKENDKD